MKSNCIRLLILSFSSILSLTAVSSPLSPDQAATIAIQLKHHIHQKRIPGVIPSDIHSAWDTPNIIKPELVYEGMAPETNATAYYIFNYPSDEGFVILTSDNEVTPVLGFSESGHFDASEIPANMKSWLDGYAREINYHQTSGIRQLTPSEGSQSGPDRPIIEPLITTRWNQDAPYNNQCPVIKGLKAPTSCTATALAQIMNYHKCPQGYGKDSWSYTRDGYTISFDFSTTQFDWENMTDTYGDNSTEEEKEAVATLMRAAGILTDAFYGRTSSGAYMYYIPENLAHYAGYSPGARYVMRDWYNSIQWEDVIYSELASGRPVQYEGYTQEMGHSFVVDGYAGNHFFHINWGWGGYSDGYFLLSALNPREQGIGSSEGGYNSYQAAVIGIHPDDGSIKDDFVNLYTTGPLGFMPRPALHLKNYTIHNNINTHSVSLSVKFVSADDQSDVTVFPPAVTLDMGGYSRGEAEVKYGENQELYNYLVNIDKQKLKEMSPGNYRLYPVYKSENMDWTEIPVSEGESYLTVSIDAKGQIKNLGNHMGKSLLTVLPVHENPIYVWDDGTSGPSLPLSVTNKTEIDFSGELNLIFCSKTDGTEKANGKMEVSIPAYQSKILNYSGAGYFPREDGSYIIIVKNSSNENLAEFEVELKTIQTPGLMAYYFDLPEHLYESSDFSTQPLSVSYYNSTDTPIEIQPELRVVSAKDFTNTIMTYSGPKLTVNANKVKTIKYSNWNPGEGEEALKAGDYFLIVYNTLTDKQISLPHPLRIWKEADNAEGLFVGINSEGNAYIVPPATSPMVSGRPQSATYKGILDIPESVAVNNKEYKVNSIEPDALSLARLDGIVVRSPEMDYRALAVAMTVSAYNKSSIYLMADNYFIQSEEAASYSLETYALAESYFLKSISGDPEMVSADNILKYNIVALPELPDGIGYDLNMTIESSNPNIMATLEPCDLENAIQLSITALSDTDKGKVTVTPRQPYSTPLTIAVNGWVDSGIYSPTNSSVRIIRNGNRIEVYGAEKECVVELYTAEGLMIGKTEIDNAGRATLDVTIKGIGLLSVADRIFKIVL